MKDVILNKSLELFSLNGFKTVTMDDIAKELAISKKTIYTYYNSKEALVKATTEYVLEKATDQLNKISGSCETPIHEHFEMKKCLGNIFSHDVQASTVYQFNKYYPKIAEHVNNVRKKNLDNTIVENLKKGVEKGYYREEIDIEFISKMFFSATQSFFNDEETAIKYDNDSVRELNFKFIEYHLRGIVTPKGLEILEELLKPSIPNEV